MPEARIEIDDDELYEQLTTLKDLLGITWKGLVVQGAIHLNSEVESLGNATETLSDGEVYPDKDEVLYLRALSGGSRHVQDIANVVTELDSKRHPVDTVQQQLEYLSKATDYVEQVDETGNFRLTREGEIEMPFR